MSFVSVAAAADSKRVVLVQFFGRDFRPSSDSDPAIRAELLRQSPHSLMFARFSEESSEVPFVELLASFEMATAAQGQNAGRCSPAECQP